MPYIGKSAFRNTAIVKADLRSLKYIFSDTFLYSDLEEITLSSKCRNIEDGAFGECNQLKKINFIGTQEEWKSLSKNISLWVNKEWYDKMGIIVDFIKMS